MGARGSFIFTSAMEFGRPLWLADPREGFIRGTLVDFNANAITIQPDDNSLSQILACYDDVMAAEEENDRDVEDNCSLVHLNEATLLHNCRLRFHKKHIYSYVGNILMAVNPYEQLDGMYGAPFISEYSGKSLGTLPPHIYAIGEKARRELRRTGASQSVVVSGESGSGKTESQKAILSFLCAASESVASSIQKSVLETNPVLEAFGNAKTLRNHNSSRFGKFIEVHFDRQRRLCGGFVSHYLLERTRVATQSPGERNYHIFYQLIAGVDQQTFQKLRLDKPSKFRYLASCPAFFAQDQDSIPSARISAAFLSDAVLDDASQLATVSSALRGTGLDPSHLLRLYALLAAILHLGNVTFIDDAGDSRGGCRVESDAETSLLNAAQLLGLEQDELRVSLVSRIMQPTRGGAKGTLIRVPLKSGEASAARDALSKSLYSRLFDWVVARMNSSIPYSNSAAFIGVLDIAGFEFFAHNSFEQFCINYCNEKLHHFFTERVLGAEQRLYKAEGIPIPPIHYTDNADCLDLFEARGIGLFDLLDEESRMPRPSGANFTTQALAKHSNNFRIEKARKAKEFRQIRDDEGFLIRHYAGTVCYDTSAFLAKNNDALHVSLQVLMESSASPLIRELFGGEKEQKPKAGSNINRLRSVSVGNKFKNQLNDLLLKLEKTGTHFVRCVKPNEKMSAKEFDGGLVLAQLRCAGIPSLLKLMDIAYPSRVSCAELYCLYAQDLPEDLARLEPRLFSKCLFRAIGLSPDDYAFGISKVFFRSGKFAEFDTLVSCDPSEMAVLVAKTKSALITLRWRMVQYAAWQCVKLQRKIEYRRHAVVTIQRYVRGFIARQRFRPRMALLSRAQQLQKANVELRQGDHFVDEVVTLNHSLQQLIQHIRMTQWPLEKATAEYGSCVEMVDTILASIRDAEALRREREAEEERRREEEKHTKLVLEEKQRRLQREEERLAAEKAAKKREEEEERTRKEEEEKQKKEEMEKERNRLDATLREQRREDDRKHQPPLSENDTDLSTWQLSKLRDTINKSTDVSQLLRCKEEFHRRLRVYNEWRTRQTGRENPVPTAAAISRPLSSDRTPLTDKQRFFKVSIAGRAGQNGLRYAHFNGQWIARQIEMQPRSGVSLLVAGEDDLNMLDVSLEQSGLCRRKGAEIRKEEFEAVWTHHGGSPKSP